MATNTFTPKPGLTYWSQPVGTKTYSTTSGGKTTSYPVAPTQNFNNAPYVNPIKVGASGGQVLGVETSQIAPSASSGGNPNPASSGNVNIPDMSGDISDLYQPALDTLTTAGENASAEFNTDQKNLLDQVANSQKQYGTQQDQLLQDTQNNEDSYNNTLKSAYDQAVRAFNALAQQGRTRAGALSSFGQALGELAQQEFFRQQGGIQQEAQRGAQQFAQERGRIKTFIASKLDDLDNMKNQALAQLKKNLNDTLTEISMRKADVEANKTKDRMAALQNTINQVRDVQSADRQFRQQLGLAAVSQMQQIAGRTFTPAEIKATLSEFMSDLPSNVGATTTGVQSNQQPVVRKATNFYDELNQLYPYGA